VKVFAVFSESLAGLVKVWAQSWAARGWRPQLISERELEALGSPEAAAKARGGGLLADVRVINFSYPARHTPKRRAVQHGRNGWLAAPLVRFPSSATEEDVRGCGRPLD
jgi:hypothetical protein